MYAVVGETLGADEFEAKFFKGKVGSNNFVRTETRSVKKSFRGCSSTVRGLFMGPRWHIRYSNLQ